MLNTVIGDGVIISISSFSIFRLVRPIIFIPFHCHAQNATIPCRSQELLPFLSVMYFFLPPFSTNYSSILLSPHLAIYFLVYLSILLFPNSYIIPFWEFYFLPLSVHAQTNVIYLTLLSLLYSFINSIAMCRMQQFLAVLRSFFHSSLLCAFPCHPSPPTILPSSVTYSFHLFHGLPRSSVYYKQIF